MRGVLFVGCGCVMVDVASTPSPSVTGIPYADTDGEDRRKVASTKIAKVHRRA